MVLSSPRMNVIRKYTRMRTTLHSAHWKPLTGWDDPAKAILNEAEKSGAKMLVMGGYGHSRLREFVLGGATRTILSSMTLPVLMAH